MNHKRCLTLIFVAASSIFAPIHASALSVNDFEKMNAQQQANSYDEIVKEAIHDAFQVDQKTGVAVGKYFTTVPPGASETEGYTAFDAELRDELKNNQNNPAKLDSVQIEAIIADVIETYVLPNIAQNTSPPAPAPGAP